MVKAVQKKRKRKEISKPKCSIYGIDRTKVKFFFRDLLVNFWRQENRMGY